MVLPDRHCHNNGPHVRIILCSQRTCASPKIHARWVQFSIPPEQQQASDFGRVDRFDTAIVRIETACGIVG
jgi:hypothetical protein